MIDIATYPPNLSPATSRSRIMLPGAAAFCLLALTASALAQGGNTPDTKSSNAEYADFYTGQSGSTQKGIQWVQAISVSQPAYCSNIKGDTTVSFTAPGMTKAEALCWQQPTAADPSAWGHDVVVASIPLDPSGAGSFVFHADQFPNGPIMLRIHAKDEGKKQDLCQVQLFNQGGVVWNQGIPKSDPPAAAGMKLAFSDDFAGPLSISGNGTGATYEAHKTGGGDFSGFPFTSPTGPLNPFSQVGTWLRIHASKPPGTKGSTGIISSLHEDGSGFTAKVPCYFECRLMAQSAPGAWPAFWTLTKGDKNSPTKGCDEDDIIEAYGGQGPRNPNFVGYAATSHFWAQPKPAWQLQKGADGKTLYHGGHVDVPMMSLGGKSTWSTTFHTYGLLVTQTDTVYYFDNIEVLRHPTGDISKAEPIFFMINYAIGGISGWHIDLARYGNQSDMWVDFVRAYQGG
jgi:hypothetical protein